MQEKAETVTTDSIIPSNPADAARPWSLTLQDARLALQQKLQNNLCDTFQAHMAFQKKGVPCIINADDPPQVESLEKIINALYYAESAMRQIEAMDASTWWGRVCTAKQAYHAIRDLWTLSSLVADASPDVIEQLNLLGTDVMPLCHEIYQWLQQSGWVSSIQQAEASEWLGFAVTNGMKAQQTGAPNQSNQLITDVIAQFDALKLSTHVDSITKTHSMTPSEADWQTPDDFQQWLETSFPEILLRLDSMENNQFLKPGSLSRPFIDKTQAMLSSLEKQAHDAGRDSLAAQYKSMQSALASQYHKLYPKRRQAMLQKIAEFDQQIQRYHSQIDACEALIYRLDYASKHALTPKECLILQQEYRLIQPFVAGESVQLDNQLVAALQSDNPSAALQKLNLTPIMQAIDNAGWAAVRQIQATSFKQHVIDSHAQQLLHESNSRQYQVSPLPADQGSMRLADFEIAYLKENKGLLAKWLTNANFYLGKKNPSERLQQRTWEILTSQYVDLQRAIHYLSPELDQLICDAIQTQDANKLAQAVKQIKSGKTQDKINQLSQTPFTYDTTTPLTPAKPSAERSLKGHLLAIQEKQLSSKVKSWEDWVVQQRNQLLSPAIQRSLQQGPPHQVKETDSQRVDQIKKLENAIYRLRFSLANLEAIDPEQGYLAIGKAVMNTTLTIADDVVALKQAYQALSPETAMLYPQLDETLSILIEASQINFDVIEFSDAVANSSDVPSQEWVLPNQPDGLPPHLQQLIHQFNLLLNQKPYQASTIEDMALLKKQIYVEYIIPLSDKEDRLGLKPGLLLAPVMDKIKKATNVDLSDRDDLSISERNNLKVLINFKSANSDILLPLTNRINQLTEAYKHSEDTQEKNQLAADIEILTAKLDYLHFVFDIGINDPHHVIAIVDKHKTSQEASNNRGPTPITAGLHSARAEIIKTLQNNLLSGFTQKLVTDDENHWYANIDDPEPQVASVKKILNSLLLLEQAMAQLETMDTSTYYGKGQVPEQAYEAALALYQMAQLLADASPEILEQILVNSTQLQQVFNNCQEWLKASGLLDSLQNLDIESTAGWGVGQIANRVLGPQTGMTAGQLVANQIADLPKMMNMMNHIINQYNQHQASYHISTEMSQPPSDHTSHIKRIKTLKQNLTELFGVNQLGVDERIDPHNVAKLIDKQIEQQDAIIAVMGGELTEAFVHLFEHEGSCSHLKFNEMMIAIGNMLRLKKQIFFEGQALDHNTLALYEQWVKHDLPTILSIVDEMCENNYLKPDYLTDQIYAKLMQLTLAIDKKIEDHDELFLLASPFNAQKMVFREMLRSDMPMSKRMAANEQRQQARQDKIDRLEALTACAAQIRRDMETLELQPRNSVCIERLRKNYQAIQPFFANVNVDIDNQLVEALTGEKTKNTSKQYQKNRFKKLNQSGFYQALSQVDDRLARDIAREQYALTLQEEYRQAVYQAYHKDNSPCPEFKPKKHKVNVLVDNKPLKPANLAQESSVRGMLAKIQGLQLDKSVEKFEYQLISQRNKHISPVVKKYLLGGPPHKIHADNPDMIIQLQLFENNLDSIRGALHSLQSFSRDQSYIDQGFAILDFIDEVSTALTNLYQMYQAMSPELKAIYPGLAEVLSGLDKYLTPDNQPKMNIESLIMALNKMEQYTGSFDTSPQSWQEALKDEQLELEVKADAALHRDVSISSKKATAKKTKRERIQYVLGLNKQLIEQLTKNQNAMAKVAKSDGVRIKLDMFNTILFQVSEQEDRIGLKPGTLMEPVFTHMNDFFDAMIAEIDLFTDAEKMEFLKLIDYSSLNRCVTERYQAKIDELEQKIQIMPDAKAKNTLALQLALMKQKQNYLKITDEKLLQRQRELHEKLRLPEPTETKTNATTTTFKTKTEVRTSIRRLCENMMNEANVTPPFRQQMSTAIMAYYQTNEKSIVGACIDSNADMSPIVEMTTFIEDQLELYCEASAYHRCTKEYLISYTPRQITLFPDQFQETSDIKNALENPKTPIEDRLKQFSQQTSSERFKKDHSKTESGCAFIRRIKKVASATKAVIQKMWQGENLLTAINNRRAETNFGEKEKRLVESVRDQKLQAGRMKYKSSSFKAKAQAQAKALKQLDDQLVTSSKVPPVA